jgi:hypothetical protein
MAASATFALKAGVWFRRSRLLMVSPDSRSTACPPSGTNSTYRPVQISGTGSAQALQKAASTRAKRAEAERAREQQYQEERKRQEDASRRQQEQREAQEVEARRQQAEQAERDRTRGYQSITVETFVLDGRDLASKATKVSLSGVYIRQGNLDVLYADVQAAMIANSQGLHQPNVPLLTDDASREFRQHLLMCQSNPARAQMGCPVTVLGRVTTCKLSNAFGATREEPCVAVEDGGND